MKHKKSAILAAAILCLGAGIGGVFALTPVGANTSYNGVLDSAINLYWTKGSSSITPAPVKDLKAGVPQYRYLSVEPSASSSVNGTVTVSFELSIDSGYNLTGFTVSIYETTKTNIASDDAFKAYLTSETPEADLKLSPSTKTGELEIDVEDGEGSGYYGMVFEYDGTKIDDPEKWGGVLKVNQTFAETVE